MLENYFAILVFVFIGAVFGIAPVLSGMFAGSRRPNSAKNAAYECGLDAFEDARMKFDVRYYLIAILFILFDLEVAFLVPWATIFKEIVQTDSVKWFGFFEMLVFLAILLVGYVYAYAKGALDWE